MPDRPLVSILINNYNYAPFLGEAIESALGQTYAKTEVVVVDDGSTDDSRRVIDCYGARIVPVLKENGGQGSAFNAGFAACRGGIICFLDSDDVFFPDKVERVVDLFGRHPNVMWVQNNLSLTDGRLRQVGVSVPNTQGSGVVRAAPVTCLEHKVRFVLCSGISVRRRVAERFLPIPEANVSEWRYCADTYVGFWSAVAGDCYQLAESLGYYRRQDHQRFLTDNDVIRLLERQIRVEERLSAMWSAKTGRRQVGSDVYKHTMVAESLRGYPRWSAARGRGLLRGLQELVRIAGVDPQLALRQAAALLFAFGAPHVWVNRRIRRRHALAPEHTAAGTGHTPGAMRGVPPNSIHDFT